MPLASSRSASEKRQAEVKAERERQERRNRLSLPKTIKSTTRVTRESVKRRRDSRAQSIERSKKQVKSQPKDEHPKAKGNGDATKENQVVIMSPERKQPATSAAPFQILSPTPYWKVAQERRKSKKFSPPQTRSTKKKNRHSELDVEGKGLALIFSPPDQKQNAKREEEELEARQNDRDERVNQEIEKKRLLIYSPNSHACRNHNFDEEDAPADANASANTDQRRHSSPNGLGIDDKQSSFELSQLSTGANSHISDMSASHKKDLEIRDDIKAIKETLVEMVVKDKRSSVTSLQNQQDTGALDAERAKTEELRAAKSALESTVVTLKSTVDANQSGFEASKQEFEKEIKGLKDELVTLQGDKSVLLKQVATLEDDLKETRDMLSSSKADSQAIQELMAQIEVKEKENATAKQDLEKVQAMLLKVEGMKEDLQAQIKAELEESAKIKGQLSIMESTKEDLEAQIKSMECEMKKDATQNESRLDEALTQYKKQDAERENAINDLMERLTALRRDKESRVVELQKVKEEKEAQDKQLSDLKMKHKQTKETFSREKDEVQDSLATLKISLEKNAEELRKAREESSEKSSTILKLEAALQDAVSRLSTSDDREDELLRKLAASDRIRAALHNRVTQLSGNIRVFVRVRPSIPGEEERLQAVESKTRRSSIKNKPLLANAESPFHFPGALDPSSAQGDADDLTKRLIEVKEPKKDRGGLSDRRKQWRFPFDAVFTPDNSQDDVWQGVEPLVQCAIDGFPVCIFAYGQTGSGKTYTMLGEAGNEGVIARAVNKMFMAKRELEEYSRGTTKVEMSVELLEIYNEQVRDLLVPNAGPNGREVALKVTSNEVVGNLRLPAASEREVMDILGMAQGRRCVKATKSNAESSRSHMVFTLHFSVSMKNGIKRVGKLNICDLAGSERLGKSGANSVVKGDLMKETKAINSSLSVLSNVIEKLQAGSNSVPFRESKLTFLLQNSLGGNSKTLAIVCCNPHAAHFHESLCSIRFAEKVNKVELKAMANFSC